MGCKDSIWSNDEFRIVSEERGATRKCDVFVVQAFSNYLSGMNPKKLLPVAFLIVLVIAALFIKRSKNVLPEKAERTSSSERRNTGNKEVRFNRSVAKFYFTKHARCRMSCRHITQQEVKEILAEGVINYNKSNLDDPKGPTYALEGMTDDRQNVRIIFAPKQQHMSVVTVIDLDVEHQCDCN
jgi:hypothetical protein